MAVIIWGNLLLLIRMAIRHAGKSVTKKSGVQNQDGTQLARLHAVQRSQKGYEALLRLGGPGIDHTDLLMRCP